MSAGPVQSNLTAVVNLSRALLTAGAFRHLVEDHTEVVPATGHWQCRHDTDPVLGGMLGCTPEGLLALHVRGTILTAMGRHPCLTF